MKKSRWGTRSFVVQPISALQTSLGNELKSKPALVNSGDVFLADGARASVLPIKLIVAPPLQSKGQTQLGMESHLE